MNSVLAQIPFFSQLTAYPYLQSALIMLLVVLVAFVTMLIFKRLISHLVGKTRVSWDDRLVELLQQPVFWSVLTGGVLVALIPLSLPESADAVLQPIAVSILILLWSGFLLRFSRLVLHALSAAASEKSIVKPQSRPLFENLAILVITALAIYLVFRAWHVDMTAWLASAGIAGIALGFAAKDTLANLISGVFILADTPYKIGDYVVLDSGERGKVTHIGIRSTRLLTRSDVEVTIPNAIMGNTRIINESGGPYEKYRIRVKVSVAYGSDIDKVKALLLDIAAQDTQVCDTPEPRVRFRSFGASGLDLELLCWVATPELRGRVLDSLNTGVYKRFNEQAIEIPYDKQDIYVKEFPQQAGSSVK